MSMKKVCLSAAILAVLVNGAAWAAEPTGPNGDGYATPLPGAVNTPKPLDVPGNVGLSQWITYTCPDCCPPIGCDGNIDMDLYVRTGPSLMVTGDPLAKALSSGWMVGGGARSLFFNPAEDAAWVVDLGLEYVYNSANRPFSFVLVNIPVSIRELHRTSVHITGGREWYVLQPADTCCGCLWRFGVDAGGRYGTTHVAMNNLQNEAIYRKANDRFGSVLIAAHTDVEIPWGCCKWSLGIRAEWDYTWMDMLPIGCNLQNVNLLLQGGVRY